MKSLSTFSLLTSRQLSVAPIPLVTITLYRDRFSEPPITLVIRGSTRAFANLAGQEWLPLITEIKPFGGALGSRDPSVQAMSLSITVSNRTAVSSREHFMDLIRGGTNQNNAYELLGADVTVQYLLGESGGASDLITLGSGRVTQASQITKDSLVLQVTGLEGVLTVDQTAIVVPPWLVGKTYLATIPQVDAYLSGYTAHYWDPVPYSTILGGPPPLLYQYGTGISWGDFGHNVTVTFPPDWYRGDLLVILRDPNFITGSKFRFRPFLSQPSPHAIASQSIILETSSPFYTGVQDVLEFRVFPTPDSLATLNLWAEASPPGAMFDPWTLGWIPVTPSAPFASLTLLTTPDRVSGPYGQYEVLPDPGWSLEIGRAVCFGIRLQRSMQLDGFHTPAAHREIHAELYMSWEIGP